MEFRTLNPEEIEIRVARCTEKGAQFLLYKDARCDMNILDETVGAMNWQRAHDEHRGNLFCKVGIRGDNGEWVWKEDAGAESNTEAEKGHASDSFKRACVNWGIGRELYTSPFIWIENCTEEQRGKYVLSRKFNGMKVSKIGYDERRTINLLEVCDKYGKVLYTFTADVKAPEKKPENIIRCETCGNTILPLKTPDKFFTAEEFADECLKKYGKKLCIGCAMKLKREQNEVQNH